MADLADKEIEALCDPDNSGGYHTSRLVPMAIEIRRYRAARAADTSDVKRDSEAEQALVRRFEPGGVRRRTAAEYGVLLGAARGAIDMAVRDGDGNVDADNALEIMRNAIDTPARAANRERVRSVVLDAFNAPVMPRGTLFERSAAYVADRVAEQLAGAHPDGPSNPMEAWFRNNTRAPAVAQAVVLSDDELADLNAVLCRLAEQRAERFDAGQHDEADVFRDQCRALGKLIAAHRKAP